MARVQFAWKMALARLKSGHDKCPYCQSCLHQYLQRKWLLIEARKCAYCGLIFRYPTDGDDGAIDFYENGYEGQHATELPGAALLEELKTKNFAGSAHDKLHRVDIIRSFTSGDRLLEFGSSWGYALHQFKQAGYRPVGFELARNRADFGRQHLGVDIRTGWNDFLTEDRASFDVIYSDHSLEHTTNLREPLEKFSELLKPLGHLVFFVPNCGSLIARTMGLRWSTYIGESHTIAFTESWCRENLPRHGFTIEKLFSSAEDKESLVDGEELICVARRSAS